MCVYACVCVSMCICMYTYTYIHVCAGLTQRFCNKPVITASQGALRSCRVHDLQVTAHAHVPYALFIPDLSHKETQRESCRNSSTSWVWRGHFSSGFGVFRGAILTLGALADCLQEEAIVQIVWMSVVLPANVHHVAVDLPAVAQISHHLVNGSTEWLEQL